MIKHAGRPITLTFVQDGEADYHHVELQEHDEDGDAVQIGTRGVTAAAVEDMARPEVLAQPGQNTAMLGQYCNRLPPFVPNKHSKDEVTPGGGIPMLRSVRIVLLCIASLRGVYSDALPTALAGARI